jgi:hypothetical protein
MVFSDLFQEEEGCAFSIDGGMCQDEVHTLSKAVDDTHNCIVPMGFRKLNYEVDADRVPWCLGCLQMVELTDRSSTLRFSPIAQITGLDIDANVVGHLGPPVVAGYELEGLEAACISGNACIMVLLNDMTPQFSVFGDIDLTTKLE